MSDEKITLFPDAKYTSQEDATMFGLTVWLWMRLLKEQVDAGGKPETLAIANSLLKEVESFGLMVTKAPK